MIQIIRRWFQRQHEPEQAKEQPKPSPIRRPSLTPLDIALRLSDWRASVPLVSEMRRLLSTKFGQDMVSCIVNECRIQRGMPEPRPEVVALELGRLAGHQEVVDIMLLMAEPIEVQPEIPITYKPHPAFPREE